jgi:hypothetical protein
MLNWVPVWRRLKSADKEGVAQILTELYTEGHAARLAGKPVTACPYSPNAIPQIAVSWIAGWHDEPLWGVGEDPRYARWFLQRARQAREFVGQNDDPLTERADTLVHMAAASAAASHGPLSERFPIVREAIAQPSDLKHFDFILTIAGVFVAIMRLSEFVGEDRGRTILTKVHAHLAQWNSEHGLSGLKHCHAFFDKNTERFVEMGHDKRYIASDTLGLWAIRDILGRRPGTDEERELARTIGAVLTDGFYDWWKI